MMVEFLSVLMRALLAKSHELFRDEILQIVFSMALAIGLERFQEVSHSAVHVEKGLTCCSEQNERKNMKYTLSFFLRRV